MPDLGVMPPQELLAQWDLLAAAPHDRAPSTRNTIALAACITTLIVTITAVTGRMWMRACIDRNVDLSDKLIFGVMVCFFKARDSVGSLVNWWVFSVRFRIVLIGTFVQ